jgi:outer membrane receptor protein involved in Fe transport
MAGPLVPTLAACRSGERIVKRLAAHRRAIVCAAASFAILSSSLAADADTPSPAVAHSASAAAVLTGSIITPAGAPVAGALIVATGPMKASDVSDARGAFSLELVPGVYEIQINKGGFNTASLRDVALVAGQTQPLSVELTRADLSALRTIGTVTTSGRSGARMNLSPATTSFVSAQAFADLANPQIAGVLERLPDVTVQHLGGKPDTTIIVGGAQPYETQVLIDGHPLALGKSGVWVGTYFPSYLIGGVETQSGPGNTTQFANLAVGGTANLLTPRFTTHPSAEFVAGTDSYGSQYSNFLATGLAGHLSYVVGSGTGGVNGPYFHKTVCSVSADNYLNDNTRASSGTIQFCGDASSSLQTRGSVLKLRYDFTPSTSLEAGFVGAWGRYVPQATAFGNTIGPTTVVACLSPPLDMQCTNPAYANLIGKSVNGAFFFPGASVYNTQDLFDAQFRTSIGSNTVLVRPYVGSIQPEVVVGKLQGYYPNFFSPAGADPAAFQAFCQANFGSNTSPAGTLTSVAGQQVCYQSPYDKYEQDKLYGSTFTVIHPMGESTLNFSYDFHGQSTFAYEVTPSNITVPFSAVRYGTFSLSGDLHLLRNLGIDVGVYNTRWSLSGTQPLLSGGSPVLDGNGNPIPVALARGVSRFDPHLGFVFHPSSTVAYRLAYGTSTTFPYIGQVSGLASYGPFSPNAPQYTGGNLTESNASLAPETSISYEAGVDKRFGNGSILSADVQATVIHNVFETLTQGQPTAIGQLLAVSRPINAARLRSQLLTLKYAYAPRAGFGYDLSAAAQRSIVDGIPAALYAGGPGFPVNNVQVCGNGLDQPGIPTCIPYLKGYAHGSFTWRNGSYVALGLEYLGKNNPYYQPPFALLDLTVRHPLTKALELQASVENLLNTNSFSNLAAPNLGVPLVAGATSDGVTAYQTTYASTLIPAPARTLRVQLRFHRGR